MPTTSPKMQVTVVTKLMLVPMLVLVLMLVLVVLQLTGTATSVSVIYPPLSSQSAHANSLSYQA
jgi:hypothetical protein